MSETVGDLDFREWVVPPAETFADTMRLQYGWSTPGPEMQQRVPWLAATDGVEPQLEAMRAFVAMAYADFGGGEGKLPFPVTREEVEEYVHDLETQDRIGVYTFIEVITDLAWRYLNGQGEDYERLHELVNMHGYK